MQKTSAASKIYGVLVLKGRFSETAYVCVCLRTEFQVSSTILTSFKQVTVGWGGGGEVKPGKPRLTFFQHKETGEN